MTLTWENILKYAMLLTNLLIILSNFSFVAYKVEFYALKSMQIAHKAMYELS